MRRSRFTRLAALAIAITMLYGGACAKLAYRMSLDKHTRRHVFTAPLEELQGAIHDAVFDYYGVDVPAEDCAPGESVQVDLNDEYVESAVQVTISGAHRRFPLRFVPRAGYQVRVDYIEHPGTNDEYVSYRGDIMIDVVERLDPDDAAHYRGIAERKRARVREGCRRACELIEDDPAPSGSGQAPGPGGDG